MILVGPVLGPETKSETLHTVHTDVLITTQKSRSVSSLHATTLACGTGVARDTEIIHEEIDVIGVRVHTSHAKLCSLTANDACSPRSIVAHQGLKLIEMARPVVMQA